MQNAVEHDKIKQGLTEKQINQINSSIMAKQRVEIVPTDKGVKLYHVKRKELNS